MKKNKNLKINKKKITEHDEIKHRDEEDPLDRDMSDLIANADWRPFSELFLLAPKNQTITLRMSRELLRQYKKLAKARNTKYQKLIRQALVEFLKKVS